LCIRTRFITALKVSRHGARGTGFMTACLRLGAHEVLIEEPTPTMGTFWSVRDTEIERFLILAAPADAGI